MVTADHEIPFGGFLSLIGRDSTQRYVAIATAECIDMMDYYSTVTFAKRCADYLNNSKFINTGSSILSMIDSVIQAIVGK